MSIRVSLCRRCLAVLLPLVQHYLISVDCREESSTTIGSPHNELHRSSASFEAASNSNSNFITGTTTAASSSSLSFPRVYSAYVPRPPSVELQQQEEHLLSHVDLLHVDPQDCNHDRSQCRIYFLVHSSNELSTLLSVLSSSSNFPPTSVITVELEKTRALLEPPPDTNTTRRISSSYSTIANFPCYNDLQGFLAWMQDLVTTAANGNPNLQVTRIDIGDSFLKTQDATKGYDIYALKISTTGQQQQPSSNKSVMLVMSGLHPREYAPPELLQRWATQLVDDYGVDADTTAILDHTDIHLLLQANPDGRALAETTQPFRRKNVNEDNEFAQFCNDDATGVDLNRNFPFQWGNSLGSSDNYCRQVYRGSSPASEPETQAIINYALSIFPTGQRQTNTNGNPSSYPTETTSGIFIDVHSFGELIIWVSTVSNML
jgi:hypothetical protein